MLTVAVAGVPRAAPVLGSDRETVKVLLPLKGVALLIGIVMLCVDVSFAAQLKVPDVELKSVPAVAVPFAVAYATVTAEVEALRVMLKETVPALCATVLLAAAKASVAVLVSVVVVEVATDPLVSVLSPHAAKASAKTNAAVNPMECLIIVMLFFTLLPYEADNYGYCPLSPSGRAKCRRMATIGTRRPYVMHFVLCSFLRWLRARAAGA